MNPNLWRGLMLTLIAGAALFVAFGSYVQYGNDQFGLTILPGNARDASYRVRDVDPGSPAAKAGIRVGDSVTTVKHDFVTRATFGYPPPGTRVDVLINGKRRATLVEKSNEPAYPPMPFTIVRLCFLIIAGLLAWRRPDDASTRMLIWFLFTLGLSIALNNHEFGSPLLSIIVLQMGSIWLLLFAFAAGARFAACFPEGTATGTPRFLSATATTVSTLGILLSVPAMFGVPRIVSRQGAISAISLCFMISLLLLVVILVQRYATTRAEDRGRRQWMFLILALGLLGPAVDVGFTVFAGFNPLIDQYGSLTLLIIPFGLAYVILRHRVIDVGFVLNRAAVYGVMSIVIVGIFVVLETLLAKYVENTSHVTSTALQLAVALGLGFSIRPIHASVDRFVDTVFFRERHEAEAAIRTFAHDAAYVTDEDVLGGRCIETVVRYAGTRDAGIWLREEAAGYAAVQSTFAKTGVAGENDPAILAMRARRVVVDLAQCRTELPGAFAFPMIVRGELLGMLLCGPKAQGGETYAPDERDALEAMAMAVGHAYDALEVRELRRRLQASEAGFATGGALGMS